MSNTTGTVGGINRANYTFWRNQTSTSVSITNDDNASTGIISRMQAAWVKQVRNADSPDLITADNELYQYFWSRLQDRQRFTSETSDMAKAGWNSLKFKHGGCGVGWRCRWLVLRRSRCTS